jgi:hypothetical protein
MLHTGATGSPGRSGSVARRAGAVGSDSIPPEGAARARRRGPKPSRRSGVAADQLAAVDGTGLVAGHPGGDGDDAGDSHPGGERGSDEDLPTRPHTDHDGDPEDIAPATSERRVSGREDPADL